MNFFTSLILTLFVFTCVQAEENANANTNLNIQERIEKISESYLGSPYFFDPLGENSGYDPDPLYRFDGFDCVTYVETVLAQSLSRNNQQFLVLMNEIRYKNGEVSFLSRNHFTSVDWNLNNQQNGLLLDVTRGLFTDDYKISHSIINKSTWFEKTHKIKAASSTQISNLPYLPLAAIFKNPELLLRLQSGSIINLVNSNSQPDITHQGFAILKKDGIVYFRHASSLQKKVIEVSLINYLRKQKKHFDGINVLEVQSL